MPKQAIRLDPQNIVPKQAIRLDPQNILSKQATRLDLPNFTSITILYAHKGDHNFYSKLLFTYFCHFLDAKPSNYYNPSTSDMILASISDF